MIDIFLLFFLSPQQCCGPFFWHNNSGNANFLTSEKISRFYVERAEKTIIWNEGVLRS